MAFPPGFLDELRGRVSLAGLVGRHVKLTRRGREFAGLCPFHNEKTPSFYVVEDKNFFHCFGCGAHGDAIGFTMRADNLDFLEAVEKLAGEAGIAVPQATPEEREKARRQKTLLETLEAAATFYEGRLWSPTGQAAREYLAARGLDEATIRRFRLGWAPGDRQALRRTLVGEYAEPLLTEAGLLHRPADGEPYDYFRGRVIFPIGDRAGRVIAFGGRVLDDSQPKYLNSPESPVFEKGRVLYGWSAARAAGGDAIVTEGYMDVIALHRAGFASAVAPLGTALGEFQLQELWRLGPEPVLCFDGDAAGQRAAARALRRALPLLRPGHSLRFAALAAGEDPDSLVRGGGGAEVFEQVLATARPLSQMLWQIECGAGPADTPERRADLDRRLTEDVALIADPTVRGEYRRFFRDQLYQLGRSPRKAFGAAQMERTSFPSDVAILPSPRGRKERQVLLGVFVSMPSLVSDFGEQLAGLDFPEPELDRLRRAILEAEATNLAATASDLRKYLAAQELMRTANLVLATIPPETVLTEDDPNCMIEMRSKIEKAMRSLFSEIAAAQFSVTTHMTDDDLQRLTDFKAREARDDPMGGRA